jgi:zinc protease
VTKSISIGSNKKATVYLIFPNNFHPSVMSQTVLEVLAEGLNQRINQRLREKEGGTYSSYTNVSFSERFRDIYSFQTSFFCDPENVEFMVAAIMDEVRKLADFGFDSDLYKKSMENVSNHSLIVNISSNQFWLDYLTKILINEGNPTEVLKRQTMLSDIIDIGRLNRAAQKYIFLGNSQVFVLRPKNFE